MKKCYLVATLNGSRVKNSEKRTIIARESPRLVLVLLIQIKILTKISNQMLSKQILYALNIFGERMECQMTIQT